MKPEPTYFDSHTEPLERRIATGLHKLGLASKHQTWRAASGEGLSPTQGQILAALTTAPRRVSELATLLGIGLPTTSESVRALVDKGLVEKTKDPLDARASLLRLTHEGNERATRATGWPELLATAVGAMSVHEQEVFYGGVVKMIRALQDAGQIPTMRMCVTCVHFRPHMHTGDKPHHCALVDAPMAASQLRLDCDEHQPAQDLPGLTGREIRAKRRETIPACTSARGRRRACAREKTPARPKEKKP